MSVRRVVLYAGLTFSLSSLAFSLGSWSAQRSMAQQIADNDARLSALQDNLARSILRIARRARSSRRAPTASGSRRSCRPTVEAQSALIDEIKRQLQSEMGLMPVRLLRERRDSFVELNAVDNFGKTSYGTAGYLGDGLLHHRQARRDRARRSGRGARRPPHRVDHGPLQEQGPARHASSTAATRTSRCTRATGRSSASAARWTCRALRIDTAYGYDFAEPIFRLGQRLLEGHHPQHRLRRAADRRTAWSRA